jgi:DNA-binding MarR family transcriptional regulator
MVLLRVSKRLLAHFHQRFEAQDLSPGKYSVLMELLALGGGGALMPSELAERIGVTRPTITGLVDGLVKQGLVERAAAANDRRAVRVRLTRAGKRRMGSLLPGQFAAMASIVDGLSKRDRATLRRLLGSIEEKMDGSDE